MNKNSLEGAYNNLRNQVAFVKDNDFDSRGVCDVIYSAQQVILVLCKLGNMWAGVNDSFLCSVGFLGKVRFARTWRFSFILIMPSIFYLIQDNET